MQTSRYFERTLFYDRSPAAEEYYARSAETIFEKDAERSKVEVRVQTSVDARFYERKKEKSNLRNDGAEQEAEAKFVKPTANDAEKVDSGSAKKEKESSWKFDHTKYYQQDDRVGYGSETDDAWSLSSKASSTALGTALDQHRGNFPPTYPGPPKLTVVDLDISNIQDFIKRTTHDFRVFCT